MKIQVPLIHTPGMYLKRVKEPLRETSFSMECSLVLLIG